ncbi:MULTISPECIES: ASCH domain-containing protein [Enterobacterales]|nr:MULTISPECIES: hypothetical protein [Enterobacterales]WOO51729.1 hypothetical protein R2S03_09140 [Hafnia alvei]WPF06198.1 hypothetical protein SB028_07990 [Proteus vulgaris]
MQVIRFNEMTSELASKEGEGDLSLAYWTEKAISIILNARALLLKKWSLSLRNLNL